MKDLRRAVWYALVWFTMVVVMDLLVRAVAALRSGFSGTAAFSVFSGSDWFLEALVILGYGPFVLVPFALVHDWINGLLAEALRPKSLLRFFVNAWAFQVLLAGIPLLFLGPASLLETGRDLMTGSLPLVLATLVAGGINLRCRLRERDVPRSAVRVVGLCLATTIAVGLMASCFVRPRFAEGAWIGRKMTLTEVASVVVRLKPQGTGTLRFTSAKIEPVSTTRRNCRITWRQEGTNVYIEEHPQNGARTGSGKGALLARGTFSPDAVTLDVRMADSPLAVTTSHSSRGE